jgi:hypothetical protein
MDNDFIFFSHEVGASDSTMVQGANKKSTLAGN